MIKLAKNFLYKFSNWKEVKDEVLKLKNINESDITIEKAIDRLQPVPFLWYEDDKGERYYPPEDPDEQIKHMETIMDEGKQMVTRGPIVQDSYIDKDNREIFRGETSFGSMQDVILFLVNNKKWNLLDAITICAICCSRCMNVIAEDATSEIFKEKDNYEAHHTHCELCNIIDPEYDKWYTDVWEPGLKDSDFRNERNMTPLFLIDEITADLKIQKARLKNDIQVGDLIILINVEGALGPYVGRVEKIKGNLYYGKFNFLMFKSNVKIYEVHMNKEWKAIKVAKEEFEFDIVEGEGNKFYIARLKVSFQAEYQNFLPSIVIPKHSNICYNDLKNKMYEKILDIMGEE